MRFIEFMRSFGRLSRDELRERVEAVHNRVSTMSSDDAESAVRDYVMMGDLHAVQSPGAAPDDLNLHSTVRSLFTAYKMISGGGMELRRAEVCPYSRDRSLVQIGTDIDGAAVVVRPVDGRVFVVEDDGQNDIDLTDAYPSVWHYVLEVAEHTFPNKSRRAI
jgi:hypothetical protein